MTITINKRLEDALRELLKVVIDARSDEDADGNSTAGAYLFGDVMSEAVEAAEDVLAKIDAEAVRNQA